MASRFLMAIVDRNTGETVTYEPGRGIEKDFVADCTRRILEKLESQIQGVTPVSTAFVEQVVAEVSRRGVGVGRTTAHVAEDVRDALFTVLGTRNPSTPTPALKVAVREGVEDAVLDLKAQIRSRA